MFCQEALTETAGRAIRRACQPVEWGQTKAGANALHALAAAQSEAHETRAGEGFLETQGTLLSGSVSSETALPGQEQRKQRRPCKRRGPGVVMRMRPRSFVRPQQAGLLTVNFRQQSRRKARTGPFLILSRGGVWDTLSRRKGWVWADAHGCADSSLKEEKLWDSGLTPISRL